MKNLWKLLAVIFAILIISEGFLFRFGETFTPLFKIGDLSIAGKNMGIFTLEGLTIGILAVLKILTVVLSTSLFIATTSIQELSFTMNKLKIPYTLSVILLLSLRFTSLVEDTFYQIISAKKLKGLDVENMNPIDKIRKVYLAVIPIWIATLFRRGLTTQIALESRAFGSPSPKTTLEDIKMKSRDYIFIVLLSVIFILCLRLITY